MTRIHVVSLPHTLLTRSYDWCAYTAKVRRFALMLELAGIDCVLYGPDIHDDLPVLEYVPIVNEADRQEWFGASEWDRNTVFDRWDVKDVTWTTTNQRAAAGIRERWQDGDMIGLIGGLCQQGIVEQLADLKPLVTEWGIGYSGVIPGTHRVYESYAWAHHVAGFYREDDIRYFDTVIPNCFGLDEFEPRAETGDYLLYMGRPNPRKGLDVIAEVAKRVDLPFIVAGQPGPEIAGTTYVGLQTGQAKKDLLAGARALYTPTVYLEPFGGVAVEAMLSGTPVIASDWGVFTETVTPDLTGFRCRMLHEFVDAADQAADLDRVAIREHAESRWSLQVGAGLYGDYLRRLETLYGEGWYTATDAFRPC